METGTIIGIALAVPVVLFPVAFVWYLNVGGLAQAAREVRRAKAARKTTTVSAKTE